MKLENFFLAVDVLEHILTNPECTIPQLRDFYGLEKEKSLYKVTSYLNKYGLIDKIENRDMVPGGPHFFLKATKKGWQTHSMFKELFDETDLQSSNLSESDLSIEFSKFSYGILNSLLQGLLYELPKDSRLFLSSNRSISMRLKRHIEKSHAQLQDKFLRIIDSL